MATTTIPAIYPVRGLFYEVLEPAVRSTFATSLATHTVLVVAATTVLRIRAFTKEVIAVYADKPLFVDGVTEEAP